MHCRTARGSMWAIAGWMLKRRSVWACLFLLYTEGYRKVPVEAMPHRVAFSDWAKLPERVEELLAAG